MSRMSGLEHDILAALVWNQCGPVKIRAQYHPESPDLSEDRPMPLLSDRLLACSEAHRALCKRCGEVLERCEGWGYAEYHIVTWLAVKRNEAWHVWTDAGLEAGMDLPQEPPQ